MQSLIRPLLFCFLCSCFLNSEMATNVDPDQTAPVTALQEQSDLGLYCLHMPFCQKLLCGKF